MAYEAGSILGSGTRDIGEVSSDNLEEEEVGKLSTVLLSAMVIWVETEAIYLLLDPQSSRIAFLFSSCKIVTCQRKGF